MRLDEASATAAFMRTGMPSAAVETVAFQGEPGAYGEEAVRRHFGDAAAPLPQRTLSDVFRALADRRATHAVAALENSQAGSIHRTYDLLRGHDVFMVGETEVPVDHCLLALPGTRIEDVRRVHSHPVALDQCHDFLDKLGAEAVAQDDTAGSARMVAESRLAGEGAIASRRAGELYGLTVLAEAVQTVKDNRTRFAVLAREPLPRQAGPQKTSILMATDHRPGALYRALGAFASRGVNLLKLESRPSRGRPWEYVFYLDVEGHRDDEAMRGALVELAEGTSLLRVLGSYPRVV